MGVLGIVAGIAAFIWPGVTALALLYIVAFWAIAIGVMQIIAAIRLRKEIQGELWMAIGGAILIIYGIFLIAFPGSGLLSLVWVVAISSIAFGIASLVLAWQLRKRASDLLADVGALTAPEMEGRGSATAGGERAARYIADAFARTGLRPGGDGGTFFQEFPVARIRGLGPGNVLEPMRPPSRRKRARYAGFETRLLTVAASSGLAERGAL